VVVPDVPGLALAFDHAEDLALAVELAQPGDLHAEPLADEPQARLDHLARVRLDGREVHLLGQLGRRDHVDFAVAHAAVLPLGGGW
jgi:hypothetical protein